MIEKLYKFTCKKTGQDYGYSRHEFPDFVSGLIFETAKSFRVDYETKKKIRDKHFKVIEITDKDEIKKHVW